MDLSEKELSVIQDLLNEEELLVKKFQMLANHSGANIRNRDNYGLLNALKEKEEPVVNESDLDRKYISDVDKSERRKIFDGRNPGKII